MRGTRVIRRHDDNSVTLTHGNKRVTIAGGGDSFIVVNTWERGDRDTKFHMVESVATPTVFAGEILAPLIAKRVVK